MGPLLVAVDVLALAGQAVIGLGFLVYSILEKEKRASFYAALQFICMALLLSVFVLVAATGFFYSGAGLVLLVLGSLAGGGILFFLVRRTSANERALRGSSGYVVGDVQRFDERKVVFSRVRYQPGMKEYDQFYAENPELFDRDEKRRAKGFVLGTFGSIDAPHEKPNVAAMIGLRYFGAQMGSPEVVRPVQAPFFKGHREVMSLEKGAELVKGYARHLGADLVGIARLDPRWVYSHVGTIQRDGWDHGEADWSKWGQEIRIEHKYVIVFAEEMDREMIDSSPHTPCFVESMKNYAKGAFISTQLSAYIANLGYSATANHVHHYELILPPLAADAGLGEVGRLGYLMTREFGPRVRLSAVTTDMELAVDKPVDIGVEDFCRICRKCAETCPSQSIPAAVDMTEENGMLRWKLDADSCFGYWGKIGTDCCICMRVCPWSHARTWPHKLIVWWIARNRWARRLFNRMDDIFYGTHPKAKMPPGWAGYRKDN
jgi:reductive dehalogenase